jgi:hypothetical protein
MAERYFESMGGSISLILQGTVIGIFIGFTRREKINVSP